MLKEKTSDNQANKEVEEKIDQEKLSDEDKVFHTKAGRTRDDVKELFVKEYGFIEGDPYLDKIVDRELSHGKVVSKLIRQKIGYRDKISTDTSHVEDNDSVTEGDKQSFRKEAAQEFVGYIQKEFPNLDAKEVYSTVREKYQESGKELKKEDFLGTLKEIFKKSYAEDFETKVRADERNKVRKEDKVPDFSEITSSGKGAGEGEQPKKFFSKSSGPKDWYGNKK